MCSVSISKLDRYMGDHIERLGRPKSWLVNNANGIGGVGRVRPRPTRSSFQLPCGHDTTTDQRNDSSGVVVNGAVYNDTTTGRPTVSRSKREEEVVNPYKTLQVRKDATPLEIRHSYKRLALWHHPGRLHDNTNDSEERNRRYQMFEILAACCEALLEKESRERCDKLLREMDILRQENHHNGRRPFRQLSNVPEVNNAQTVDGKPKMILAQDQQKQKQQQQQDQKQQQQKQEQTQFKDLLLTGGSEEKPVVIPALSRVSSSSSDDDEKDQGSKINMLLSCVSSATKYGSRCFDEALEPSDHFDLDDDAIPSLIGANSSSSEEEAYMHYTSDETNRLFGGPLSLLYKARNWKKFTDPFIYFERIFGAKVFNYVYPEKNVAMNDSSIRARAATSSMITLPQQQAPDRSAAWTGTSEKLENGDIVYTTSRILHNRKLTKTETISHDPITGQKRSRVEVTSEDLCETIAEVDYPPPTCYLFGALDCCNDDDIVADSKKQQTTTTSSKIIQPTDYTSITFFFLPSALCDDDDDAETSFQDYCQRWQQFLCMPCGDIQDVLFSPQRPRY